MRNVLANPYVGLIFLVLGRDETLRINGRAWITRDPVLLERCVVGEKTPSLAVGVEVEECFMHCARSFRRSELWSPGKWPSAEALPSLACILFEQIKPDGVTLEDWEQDIQEAYSNLY
jgi:hypothetical protein